METYQAPTLEKMIHIPEVISNLHRHSPEIQQALETIEAPNREKLQQIFDFLTIDEVMIQLGEHRPSLEDLITKPESFQLEAFQAQVTDRILFFVQTGDTKIPGLSIPQTT